ncbi:ABC transporter ATP-binding protein [Candidatus Neptunichlamydia sp. REUL1]|uniref:ABC transporter ATP-binding protein n=1 Tax=Candidatus Neptunichlamydia sp. REUL1 TaxID=3064277 RepID=UPI00292CED73|nr:ABC transporter ATP-binding protein [Candidatus Neptunochlamydia sp. REUL1]
MLKRRKEYVRNIYNIIFKRKKKDLIKFFFISTPGCLAAFLEGITFTLLLSSLYIMSGKGVEVFHGKPILSKIARIPHLQEISSNQLFVYMVIAAIFAQILKSLVMYLSALQAAKLNARIGCDAHQNIYSHILSFNFSTVSNYKTGGLASYTQIPSGAIIPMLQSFHKVIVQSCVLGVLSLVLFKISAPLTLFFCGFFFISGIAYKKILAIISRFSEECATKLLQYNNDVVQAINGIKLIHIFGMQKTILKRSHSLMAKMQGYQQGNAKLQALLLATGEVFSMVMMAATIAISSLFLVISNEHSLPLLLTYTVTAYRFTTTAREILNHFGVMASQSGSIVKLNEILTTKDKGFEPTDGVAAAQVRKGIEFRNTSFRYPSKKQNALDSVSLFIPHQKLTAIVGLSGAGKTSLVSLITRLFEPTEGKILIDGVELSKYNIQSWRSKLGVVSQNTVIFNDPARENVCFGTTATDEEVLEACKTAGCYEVITNLPDGLDSPLGEHGYKISGGEAQRIAIARALIRNPEIMIFDEATSNLDSLNEQTIKTTLEKCRNRCTLIVIAHRLSTIISADQIIVLNDGQVAETGTHEDLIEANGEYSYLWHLQSTHPPERALV